MNLSTTMAAMAMTGLVLATIPTPAEAQSATERFEQCADDWYAAYSVGWDKLGMYERHCCDGGQPDQYCAGTLEARQNIQRWLTRGGGDVDELRQCARREVDAHGLNSGSSLYLIDRACCVPSSAQNYCRPTRGGRENLRELVREVERSISNVRRVANREG